MENIVIDVDDENEVQDFDLVNFLSIETESDEEEEVILNERQCVNIVNGLINKVAQVQIKEKMSYKGSTGMVELMNNMPNVAIEIPFNRKTVKKYSNKAFEHRILVFCERCNALAEHETKCQTCERVMLKNSKKYNYMVYIPVEPQIRQILNKYFDVIKEYLDREHVEGVISDTDEGKLFKNIGEKHKNSKLLSFTLNTDGANLHKSSKKSLWPVQLYFNGLPPNMRFLFENIIVTVLYYGQNKPDMKTLLYPLAKEFDYLNKELISVRKENNFYYFLPALIVCTCDLPARAELQNMKAPTGFYACPYCYQQGKSIKNAKNGTTVRYIKTKNVELRTHKDTIEIAKRVEINGNSIKGIKGHSSMIMFDHLDVIDSCAIDYMHGVPLGIFKDLMLIWLGIKRIPQHSYCNYKIRSVENRKIFNNRILGLKPYMTFNRKPRSIFDVRYFKASELLYLMWYYVRYALVGLLPTPVIKNFEMLSAATYILCKEQIEISEMRSACDMLIKFADEFEIIYGPGATTMNVHLLRHYHNMMTNCGPLWSYGLFGFENNIGKLKGYVVGTTDVLEQVLNKYLIDKNTTNQENFEYGDCQPHLLQPKLIKIEPKYGNVLKNSGIIGCEQTLFKIFCRMRLKAYTYTSTQAIETKSIDYFVKMKSGNMGKIAFFFERDSSVYLLIQLFTANFQNYHLLEVTDANRFMVYPCAEIQEKLLYFKIGSIEYVTKEPNTFGKYCY